MAARKFRPGGLWPAALIALAAAWVYSPAFDGGWIWDDAAELAQNPLLRGAGGLRKIWFAPEGPDYFPLKNTVQWVQWHLWGAHPLGYHLTNVGLHVLAALLLWGLLRRLGARLAWVAGLLLVVHPLAVESVAWMAELKNVLSLPLLLLAMICFVDSDERARLPAFAMRKPPRRSATREGGAARLRPQWGSDAANVSSARSATRHLPDGLHLYVGSVGLFLAAMLCKSAVVMFPGVLLLYAWWRRGRITWADLRAAAPFFAVSLALGLVTVEFQQHRAIAGVDLARGGALSRVAAAGLAIAFYLGQCVWPRELLPIYPRWNVDPPSLLQFGPWLVLGIILVWLWAKRGSPSDPARPSWGRTALFALGTFLLNLAPVLGAVPMAYQRISWVADHLAYLSLVSIVSLAAAAAGAWMKAEGRPPPAGTARPWLRRAIPGLVLAAVVFCLAAQSRRQAGIYRDEETFWTFAVRRNPRAWAARNDLGQVLLKSGRAAEARVQFAEALSLNPADAEAQFNLGLALEALGRAPEALARYEEALRLKPGLDEARLRLGAAQLGAGRLPEAIAQFQAVLRRRPADAEAHANLGVALAASRRLPEAGAELAEALRLDPEYPEANYNLGNVLAQEGQRDAAIAHFERALRARPDYAQAHSSLGVVLAGAGRWPQARAEFEQALRLRPDDAAARENLARIRALEGAVSPQN